jgi:hypothetical protein
MWFMNLRISVSSRGAFLTGSRCLDTCGKDHSSPARRVLGSVAHERAVYVICDAGALCRVCSVAIVTMRGQSHHSLHTIFQNKCDAKQRAPSSQRTLRLQTILLCETATRAHNSAILATRAGRPSKSNARLQLGCIRGSDLVLSDEHRATCGRGTRDDHVS